MPKPLILGGVLECASEEYERPVLWFLARTIKAGKCDSCVMEVYELCD